MPASAPGLKALAQARTFLGVREQPPGSNRGPQIDQWLHDAGVPAPNPWCMAFVHGMFKLVGVNLGGWASVGNFRGWAIANHYVLLEPRERPFAGDIVCYEWNGDDWPDHVGIVEKVLALRWAGKQFVGLLRVIEGNTSSGLRGSQDDGDGVYRRTRWARASYQFVRIP